MTRYSGEEIVDRSGLRYAAMACIIAGGLLVTGSGGAIALADPGGRAGGSGHDGTSQSTGESAGTHGEGSTGLKGQSGGGYTGAPKNRRPWQRHPGKPGDGKPGDGKPGEGQGDGGRPDDPCDHDGNPGPGQPPPGNGGGLTSAAGGGQPPAWPSAKVPHVAPLQPAPPSQPGVVDLAAGPVEPAIPAIPPVLTAPVVALSVPVAEGVGAAPAPTALPESAPSMPPETFREERAREPLPARVGGTTGMSSSFRVGYSEFLRNATVWQMAALALPGLTGILMLAAAGGFIGYRQAKAGHAVRMEGIARFLS